MHAQESEPQSPVEPDWRQALPSFDETASRRDGVSEEVENRHLRGTCALIQDTGIKIGFPQWAICSAMHLFHLYFSRRSTRRNDRFLIAVASLFLAGKINESCRPPKEIIVAAWVLKCKGNRQLRQMLNDLRFLDMMCEQVIQTERVVLSIVGFDFSWTSPHTHMLKLVTKFDLANQRGPNSVAQLSLNLLNDCMRSNLCVRFPSEALAAGALTFACAIKDVEVDHSVLWENADIQRSPEVLQAFLQLYEDSSLDTTIPIPENPCVKEFSNGSEGEGEQRILDVQD
ncbi:hypothetical protein BSKO_00688 [Bryopsis sp. KO-2023]|nr:hypothetical protein BSKO_00688 [Bryopsis sp. KO-2023]